MFSQKKGIKYFGINKRVTTFVAPKEREQELRQEEEGLKPVLEDCRLHRKKPLRVSIGKKEGADFLWEKKKSSLKF